MDIKDKIAKILSKHPEGLTLNQIAKEVGIHRSNITKYVYELKGNSTILIRDLKLLKLCYLKKDYQGS
jgi:predicted transcriptional regulator